jgi:hypothetical protein
MKYFLIITLNLIVVSAYAQSEQMNELLRESNVRVWGKREYRHADILCRIPRKTNTLNCHVRSGASTDGTFIEDVEYLGDKAKEISDLLIEFNALPTGKRSRQELEVVCQFKKGTRIMNCKSTEYPPSSF